MRQSDQIEHELRQFISGQKSLQEYILPEPVLVEALKKFRRERLDKEISGAFSTYTVGDLERAIELLDKPKKSSAVQK